MFAIVKYIFTGLIIMISINCIGQTGTMYFNNNWERCEQKDATYMRSYELQPDHRYKVEDRFIGSHNLQMLGYYSSPDSNGIKDGHFVYYTDSGFITQEGNFEIGEKAGEWIYYYDNSKVVRHIEHFKNGKCIGEFISYYINGKIKEKTVYDENSIFISHKKYDENGKESESYIEAIPKPPYDLINYLSENIRYPREARKNNTTGRVITKFIVNKDGTISHVRVVKHVSPEIDAEAIRVISQMPSWKPGMQNGKAIKVYFTQPITFTLDD